MVSTLISAVSVIAGVYVVYAAADSAVNLTLWVIHRDPNYLSNARLAWTWPALSWALLKVAYQSFRQP